MCGILEVDDTKRPKRPKPYVRITRPTEEDVNPLWQWGEENRELWSDKKSKWYPKDTLTDWIKNPRNDILLVAKNGMKKPIGMCMTYAMRGWGYCTGLFVDTGYRRKGIATQLLKETIRQLKKQHISHFTFNVDPSNRKGLRLYKKLGFQTGYSSICVYKTLDS
jgi:ribosomal protein S18 acetylase RimI-like enzyme